MITAGEPQAYLPFGRQYLLHHPGEVYLPQEVTPAASASLAQYHPTPSGSSLSFSKDLLHALQGVSLKNKRKNEGWFMKNSSEGEEEFYFSAKNAVWSKSSGLGIRHIFKSFTLEHPISQILWSDFNVVTTKPRRNELEIKFEEEENSKENLLSGFCLVNPTSVTLFTKKGEDFVVTAPFEISKVWPTKYGIVVERTIDKAETEKGIDLEPVPVIFSLLHPLEDFSPIIKRTGNLMSKKLSYFYTSKESIIFTCSEPSLVVTFNQSEGCHSIWKTRITTLEEAEHACSKAVLEYQSISSTPINPMSTHITSCGSLSKFATHYHTPSNSCTPFRSLVSSRIASPIAYQSHPSSPSLSSLTKMATISRSCSPSVSNSFSRSHVSSPWNTTRKNSFAPLNTNYDLQFMDPLAPDLCFDHQWSEGSSGFHGEAASKVFISKDITGHNFLCFHLRKHMQLKLIKFEESNENNRWIFGTSSNLVALDAEPIPELNLILLIELNFTLTLYTGLVKVAKVHIPDVMGPFGDISVSNSQEPSMIGTPRRQSLITSTQPSSPMDDRFGDEVTLSPVPVDAVTVKPALSDISLLTLGTFKSLRDPIKNRVTLETSNGYYRFALPQAATSAVVLKCLDGLRSVLPRDIYTNLYAKWYCTRNAPGPSEMCCKAEVNALLLCILSLVGYDVDSVCLGGFDSDTSIGSATSAKKQKTDEDGTEDDWTYLLSCNFKNAYGENSANTAGYSIPHSTVENMQEAKLLCLNSSAVLLPYVAHVFFSMHLIYEDCKLNTMLWSILPQLCSFLFELARDLKLEEYKDYYWRDFPQLVKTASTKELIAEDQLKRISFPFTFNGVPSIFAWIQGRLQFEDVTSFPYIPHVTDALRNIILAYCAITVPDFSLSKLGQYLTKMVASGLRIEEDNVATGCLTEDLFPLPDPRKSAVVLLSKLGFTTEDIDMLPIGVSLGIRDAIVYCRNNPMSVWIEQAFNLIGRQDLLSLHLAESYKAPVAISKSKLANDTNKIITSKDSDDGFHTLDHEVLNLRFSKDHRIHDVYHMLQSSKPVRIVVQQRPEVSDYEFIEEQERHLYSISIRTMALPVGRGMFTLDTYVPVVTETLPIPKLCLTGRAPPRNTTVDLAHIDVPPNMNMWPLFHNGVAAGLRITQNASQIDSTWMVYNKPKSSGNDTPTEHAGFLMALGLNGHLSNLTSISMHDYLCKGHELTSVGILLGVSAAKRGTMDLGITKLLSIHIEALLPPTSTELDVQPVVQVASVMGIGLLYQGTGYHHMAKVMLGEIGRPPGPEMEHCIDRESYSLTAGLALGLITFGKGKAVSGLTDLPMADQLYHYMVGGHKRPLTGVHKEKHKSPSYQIREGDSVNVDVTSPGATLALGMMFFDTGNQAIAEWMTAPDTQYLLDMVRPDFLLLRTLSKGLILWSDVHPSRSWVESHIPEIVSMYAFKRGETAAIVDYETMSQAYSNIIAGCCLCLGLKFAGSANDEAFKTLMYYVKFFLVLSWKPVGEQAGRSTIETCLNVSVLSLAMVMAGTGDLEVLRICRHLRSRISQSSSYVLYGSHLATHMALGLLFLGGGKYTLNTSPLSIGAMLCAFYPKFPTHSNDNRYHLQAFYHLYVLTVEHRLIIPRHLELNKPIYTHVKIMFKDTPWYQNVDYTTKAPCMLPELKLLKQVVIEDNRYWPIVFDCDTNWDILINLLKNGGNLFLKQKAGCLPYSEDPQGFHSILAQTYITNSVHGWNLKSGTVSKFSSDPLALNFASTFLQTAAKNEKEKVWQQQVCGVLFECASREKMDILPMYTMLVQMASSIQWQQETQSLWQIKLLKCYQTFASEQFPTDRVHHSLLRNEFLSSICKEIESRLSQECCKHMEALSKFLSLKSNEYCTSKSPESLAAFLIYHDIPFTNQGQLQMQKDMLTYPAMAIYMDSWSLPENTTLTLHSILTKSA